ncbi:MAG: LPS-assembly protein LptD [Planctomycetes bacterium]|nr:LPS-assembly protein LptD [Planctomycetota bacterium]
MKTFLAIVLLLFTAGLSAQEAASSEGKPDTVDDSTPEAGKLEISYVAEDDTETYWEIWREGTDGPFVLALPFAVQLRFASKTEPGANGISITKSMTLLADSALIWFRPADDDNFDANDPLAALGAGATSIQFYGEGNIWMRYGAGAEAMTVRADRVFLDFAQGHITYVNEKGEVKNREELKLSGRLKNVRAHSGGADGAAEAGKKLGTGFGFGEVGDRAVDSETHKRVGAAPNSDAVPNAAGTPRSLPQERGLRLFLRAKNLRIIRMMGKEQEIELEDASVSSSSLAVASYSLAADLITLHLTETRRTMYLSYPKFRILDATIFEIGVDSYGHDLDSVFPIRQLDFLSSNRFGTGFRSYIDAIGSYDYFADPEPPFRPFVAGPQLDWFSLRGFGYGGNADYGGMNSFGRMSRMNFRSLYINDRGDDRDRARELGWFPLRNQDRGRARLTYSQAFGKGWQLDARGYYLSDRHFQREFYESEYDVNDPTISYLHLTRRWGNMNAFLRAQPSINSWESNTEFYGLGFVTDREPVGDFGLFMSAETRIGLLYFRPDKDSAIDPISTIRSDSQVRFNMPLEFGPFAFDPYAGARLTMANSFLEIDESSGRPDLGADGKFSGLRAGDRRRGGLLYRVLPFVGFNLQTFFTGVFPDVKIPGLDIDGIRHVIAPFVRYENTYYNSLDEIPGRAFIPLDGVDNLDEFHEIRFGVRNRIQTRQGFGENRRTVDYFELNAELPLYPNRKRDNANDLLGDLEVTTTWRPAPGFALAGEMFLEPHTGNFSRSSTSFRFDILNVGKASVYYRLLKGQHQVIGAQVDLTLSEFYGISVKQEYDMETSLWLDTRVELSRRVLEAFDLGFVFVRRASTGEIGFSINISLAFEGTRGSSGLVR